MGQHATAVNDNTRKLEKGFLGDQTECITGVKSFEVCIRYRQLLDLYPRRHPPRIVVYVLKLVVCVCVCETLCTVFSLHLECEEKYILNVKYEGFTC